MDRKKNLETCLVIVTGLLVFYLIKGWHGLLIAALIVGLIGVFFNKVASWINWLWYKISDVMGAVVSKVILAIVYIVVLIPIAFFYKISGHDTLNLKIKDQKSLWTDRNHRYVKDDIHKPW